MKKETIRTLAAILATGLIIVGFRLAAQAGQGLDALQNDGYAGSGGFLILVGGVIVGWLMSTAKLKR
jgi:hypothetical protein